jgi:two-component system chemotaxis sensor kinase CheA
MSINLDDFKKEFVEEARDHINTLNNYVIKLEDGDKKSIDEIFRAAHTLKGMAGTLGYGNLQKEAHELEDLFDDIKEGKQKITPELIDRILKSIDLIERIVNRIDKEDIDIIDEEDKEIPKDSINNRLNIKIVLTEDCALKSVRAYLVLETLKDVAKIIKTIPSEEDLEDDNFGREFSIIVETDKDDEEISALLKRIGEIEKIEIRKNVEEAAYSKNMEVLPREQITAIRVDINQLNKILNLVGELVISRGRLAQIAKEYHDSDFKDILEGIDRSISELQNEIMVMRMVPISRIFSRFPRMVRDYCRSTGKRINLEIYGEDTELDRAILDEITDPLIHLIRNSLDHGIELPEERIKKGKTDEGHVKLSAKRERDNVIIEVEDDGNGIDFDKIKEKAVSKGFISEDEAKRMTNDVAKKFIFLPGFSTSDKVDEVSGRGVGLDIVKTKVESLSGSIKLITEKGKGTRFILSLPPSMAIIRVLTVEISGEWYAIPLNDVLEVAIVKDKDERTISQMDVLKIREKIIPVVYLNDIFNIGDDIQKSSYAVIVEKSDGTLVALLVDAILDHRDILIKPLDKFLSHVKGLGGITILGNGKVVPILDIDSILAEMS